MAMTTWDGPLTPTGETQPDPPQPAATAPGQAARHDTLRLRAERARDAALALHARSQSLGQVRASVSRQELLTDSPFARLYVRVATMPVIEQAKGILIFQQGCDPDEAFGLLRRASQRSNVPLRVLAEQIVARAQRHSG
jgi:AmiR/NasT family two-component response regulator